MFCFSFFRISMNAMAVIFTIFFFGGTVHAKCSPFPFAQDKLPPRLNIYVLVDRQIRLHETINRKKLPGTVELQDCGNATHFGIIIEGKLYLVRRSDLSIVISCVTTSASQERDGATPGSGVTRICPEDYK